MVEEMKIKTIVVKEYKILKDLELHVNSGTNILVGDNGSGKSTILNAINLALSGRLGGVRFDHLLSVDDFNTDVRSEYQNSDKTKLFELPMILIEVYFQDEDNLAKYKGANNSLHLDCPGIRLTVEFNPEFETEYRDRLAEDRTEIPRITDIPIEYYHVQRYYFSGDPVLQQSNPFKTYFIDGTTSTYSRFVGHYVQSSVTSLLQPKDKVRLQSAYETMKNGLRNNSPLTDINVSEMKGLNNISQKVKLDVKQSLPDEWLQSITLDIDGIPYGYAGLGVQRTVQMALLVGENSEKPGLLLFEEPENNLSYSNMNKLVKLIENTDNRQKFIATHNSFVANKLGLKNLIVCNNGSATQLTNVTQDDLKYFQKLPGYHTLRVILSEKPVLVEGTTDELIFDKAYLTKYHKMPIEDGVDVIVVDSLAFKRYLNVARIVNKHVIVITDNDGNPSEFMKRYSDYIDDNLFGFFYEKDWHLKTLEPSFISANIETPGLSALWRLCRKRTPVPCTFTESNKADLKHYMTKNKSEWAWRVFNSKESFNFPTYINEAVDACKTQP